MSVLLKNTGNELRDATTLELLGYWLLTDNAIYWIPLHQMN